MSTIELLPHQEEFLFRSKEKFALLCGGIGSGKSWAGSHYIIKKAMLQTGAVGLITANTYKQLLNSTLACLFRELDSLGIPFKHNKNSGELTLFGQKILCTSLENYDALRGIEIGYFWADEVRDTRVEAWQVLIGRLRDKRCKLEGRLTSSPLGFNWLYDYFAGEAKTSEHRLITASSYDNPYLPTGYIDTLVKGYDKDMADQEVGGKFINLGVGKVYYAFDRQRHVGAFDEPDGIPKGGCDFNVSPITAVKGYYYDDTFWIVDEIYKENSNTYWLADEVRERWPGIELYPDATGKARKTSAVKSDHQILRSAGIDLQHTRNPHVKDRYNCLNGHLAHDRIKIHERCKKLIKDMEQLTHDNKDDKLSHISDALGYMVWALAPLEVPKSKPIIQGYA